MQQTTCGVIPEKTRVFDRKIVDCFLDENESLFMNLKNSQYCLYPNMTLISDQALNYLNSNSTDNNKEQLKILLKKEFIVCEELYPYLGDLFIHNYFIESNDVKPCWPVGDFTVLFCTRISALSASRFDG